MAKLPLVASPADVTPEWLTECLHAAGVALDARIAEIPSRSQVGTGQMAQNVRFALTWKGEAQDAPASLIGKFPSDDPTSRATGAGQGAYRKEVEFYRRVAQTVDIRTPRCFAVDLDEASGDFVILMEDLAGSVQGDQIAGCDADQAAVAVEEAAKLHAPRWGDPSLAELDFLVGAEADAGALLQGIYGALFPGFEARYADRLDPDVLEVARTLGASVGAWSQALPTARTVTHGDYRLDNMLFADSPGAPPLVVVDWQTVGRGYGVGDVSYFLGAGLAPETRRQEEERLVRAYWEQLCARGVGSFPWDDCWRDYRHMTFAGVVMAVVASQIVVQTERGDDMFVAMAQRHGRHALDLEAQRLL